MLAANRDVIKDIAGDLLHEFGSIPPVREALQNRSVTREELVGNKFDTYKGATVSKYGSSKTLTYSDPVSLGDYPTGIKHRTSNDFQIPHPFLAEFSNAQIIGRRGLALDSDGRYIIEASSLGNSELLLQNIIITIGDGYVPKRQSGNQKIDYAISLVGSWNFGYFHWNTDWLTRLDLIGRFEAQSSQKPTVILPPNITDWMQESLDLVGVPEDRRLYWTGERLDINRLLVPSVRRIIHDHNPRDVDVLDPKALAWLRETILSNISSGTRPDNMSNHIYVSRSDADSRMVKNEAQLMRKLTDFGFSRIVPSKLTVPEQIATFREADVIVGPHGAGLMNTLFAKDALLVEFFGQRVATCYLTLSEHIPVTYGFVNADPTGKDMTVNPELVIKTLQEMGFNHEISPSTD